jgi:hypothetical protein
LKPFATGLVLAVVILAVGFLTPALLPPATSPNTLKALEDAELARRQLDAYQATLPLVAAHSDLEQLKEADFDKLVERSQQALTELSQEFSKRVGEATTHDRRSGMPKSDLRAFAASGSGVRSEVSTFETSLRDNRKLLDDALRSARSASQADRNTLGVGQVAGTVKLVEAAKLLAEARRLRSQLMKDQARALAVAGEWAAVRAERDYSAGLEVTSIRGGLDADLEEIEAALTQSQAEVDELRRAVADREQALARVRADLERARTERLSMEEMGFTVGDDASFEAYRERYLAVAQRLRELQDQEQLLAFGGIRGGRVVGDDLLKGEIEGGEAVVGLNELQRGLAVATDKLERYTGGRQSLKNEISLVGAVGDEAQMGEKQCAARLETLRAELDHVRDEMAALAQQAFEGEDAALGAAREAATTFKGAKSVVDRWISDARSLQQQKDPQRANERLKLIVGDGFAADFATSAEAQANTLVGRIQTERALGLRGYLDTLTRIGELTGSGFEPGALQEQLNTARDGAVGALSEARDAYERMAQKPTSTSWVHRASLALVYHLLWQIDEFNAEQHRSNLIDQLGEVVANRFQYPDLQQEVKLWTVLTGRAEVPPPGPKEGVEEPAAEEPTDKDEGE